MARMTALRFPIALVMMMMLAVCAVKHHITPSDVPSNPLPLPTRVTVHGCFYHSYCQCDLEITSGGTGTPLACVRFIRGKEEKDTIHLSVADGNCQEDNHNHNYTVVWPTAGDYSPNVYIRSEDNKLVLTLNERSQYRLSFPMSGTAQWLTVVTFAEERGNIYIVDAEMVGSCLSLTNNMADFRVQKSDVILIKPKPSITEVEIMAKPYSKVGCEKTGFYKGKYQVQEQDWVRLELHVPKEKYSNVILTVNKQLVVTIPVSNSRCTGEEWYDLRMTGADKILNCDPGIAQNASKIYACKISVCDTCVWVIVVLILLLLGVVSVVVAFFSYKKKNHDNTSAFSFIKFN